MEESAYLAHCRSTTLLATTSLSSHRSIYSNPDSSIHARGLSQKVLLFFEPKFVETSDETPEFPIESGQIDAACSMMFQLLHLSPEKSARFVTGNFQKLLEFSLKAESADKKLVVLLQKVLLRSLNPLYFGDENNRSGYEKAKDLHLALLRSGLGQLTRSPAADSVLLDLAAETFEANQERTPPASSSLTASVAETGSEPPKNSHLSTLSSRNSRPLVAAEALEPVLQVLERAALKAAEPLAAAAPASRAAARLLIAVLRRAPTAPRPLIARLFDAQLRRLSSTARLEFPKLAAELRDATGLLHLIGRDEQLRLAQAAQSAAAQAPPPAAARLLAPLLAAAARAAPRRSAATAGAAAVAAGLAGGDKAAVAAGLAAVERGTPGGLAAAGLAAASEEAARGLQAGVFELGKAGVAGRMEFVERLLAIAPVRTCKQASGLEVFLKGSGSLLSGGQIDAGSLAGHLVSSKVVGEAGDFERLFSAAKEFFFGLGDTGDSCNAEEQLVVFNLLAAVERRLRGSDRRISQKLGVFRRNFCFNAADGVLPGAAVRSVDPPTRRVFFRLPPRAQRQLAMAPPPSSPPETRISSLQSPLFITASPFFSTSQTLLKLTLLNSSSVAFESAEIELTIQFISGDKQVKKFQLRHFAPKMRKNLGFEIQPSEPGSWTLSVSLILPDRAPTIVANGHFPFTCFLCPIKSAEAVCLASYLFQHREAVEPETIPPIFQGEHWILFKVNGVEKYLLAKRVAEKVKFKSHSRRILALLKSEIE